MDEAMAWLHQTLAACRTYRTGVFYLGNVLVGLGFSLVFGGTLRDCLWAGVMGLIIGLVTTLHGQAGGQPVFQHHTGLVPDGAARPTPRRDWGG